LNDAIFQDYARSRRGEQLGQHDIRIASGVQRGGARRAFGGVRFEAFALGRFQAVGQVGGEVFQGPGVIGHHGISRN
jgi:hypothetical protein